MTKRRHLYISGAVILLAVIAAVIALVFARRAEKAAEAKSTVPLQVQAPPDLMKARPAFTAGIEAIQENDPKTAIEKLTSFSLGSKAVEEYRLYYLATAYQLGGQAAEARATLAKLWDRNPKLVYRHDAGFTLGSLYEQLDDFRAAAEVYGSVAARANQHAVAATARAQYIKAKFIAGDPSGIVLAARRTYVENPTAPQAAAAAGLTRRFLGLGEKSNVPLLPNERIERAGNFLEDNDPASAAEILGSIDVDGLVSPLREQAILQRGIAYQRLKQYERSSKELEKLSSSQYRYAAPALLRSGQNYLGLSASINPVRYRTVTQKVKVGTKKVRSKKSKKLLVRPVYKMVKKSVKYIDKASQIKKESYQKLAVERFKDVLQIHAEKADRRAALVALLGLAQAKNQDDYVRELVTELVKIDPYDDTALNRFWGRAWAAWMRGDLAGAKTELTYIAGTYANPNVQRQARYWYARVVERQGQKGDARQIYSDIASAPYQDLYSKFAAGRLPSPPKRRATGGLRRADDWLEVAEREFPQELQLAYQLTAVGGMRDAGVEIRANTNDANRKYSDAIMGELMYTAGSTQLAFRYLKRAYPLLASVEQDRVPVHYVKMYYPIRFEETVRKNSKKRGLDPYLIMALIHQESGFDPNARSPVGASGLMQLMPATGRELGGKLHGIFTENGLLDPDVNIELGAYYIKQLVDLFNGNYELAIAGYNGGPYRIKAWRQKSGRQPLDEFIEGLALSETRNYVKRVTILRSSYEVFENR